MLSSASLSYTNFTDDMDRIVPSPPWLTFNLDQMYDDAVKLRMWYGCGNPGVAIKAGFGVTGWRAEEDGDYPVFQPVNRAADASGFTELAFSGTGINLVSATWVAGPLQN